MYKISVFFCIEIHIWYILNKSLIKKKPIDLVEILGILNKEHFLVKKSIPGINYNKKGEILLVRLMAP